MKRSTANKVEVPCACIASVLEVNPFGHGHHMAVARGQYIVLGHPDDANGVSCVLTSEVDAHGEDVSPGNGGADV